MIRKIDKVSREDLIRLVEEYGSISSVARAIGYTYNNGDKSLKNRLADEGIDFKRITPVIVRRSVNWLDVPDDEFRRMASLSVNMSDLVRRLGVKFVDKDTLDLIEYRCEILSIEIRRGIYASDRAKINAIWVATKEELQSLINESNSLTEVLARMGYHGAGRLTTLRDRLDLDKIDYSRMKGRSKAYETLMAKAMPYSEAMVENSTYNRSTLKKRLLRDGLLINRCSICGQGSTWMDKNLVMVMDHINGVNDDNRIENLRMLCPNCNSQTDTFAGRHMGLDVPSAFRYKGDRVGIKQGKHNHRIAKMKINRKMKEEMREQSNG